MSTLFSADRIRLLASQLREHLWFRPLVMCLLSVGAAFMAKLADGTALTRVVPAFNTESIESLLTILASSMLVIATFAVASMVSAYASASSAATPRSFTLVVGDDVSQNALSTFIGAFIFSIVALMAMKNNYFGAAGRFTLFLLTAAVFAAVILTFVRWVDRIARLGRIGTTIDTVEKVTAGALRRRALAPRLHGVTPSPGPGPRWPVLAPQVGYVQHVDVAALQAWAERAQGRVEVVALPGTFAAPGRVLAHVSLAGTDAPAETRDEVARAFRIGGNRRYDDDPRFGLVVLSEIAGRALSPAVNDPGTAIDIIGTLVRLFVNWHDTPADDATQGAPLHDRVAVPELSVQDMFDDAFTAVARDGAGAVEVAVRLQKALASLALAGHADMREAALHHARQALERAQRALTLDDDLVAVRGAAAFALAHAPSEPPEARIR